MIIIIITIIIKFLEQIVNIWYFKKLDLRRTKTVFNVIADSEDQARLGDA